jgi:hypothetical protein
MLIDVWGAVGMSGIVQVDLDEHRNSHQSLAALAPMAETVLATVVERARRRAVSEPAATVPAGRVPTPRLDAVLENLVPVERPALAGLSLA